MKSGVQVSVTEVKLGGLHNTLMGILQNDHDRILATASGLDAGATRSGLFDISPLNAAILVRRRETRHKCQNRNA